jgi:hypothetical protein
VISVRFALVDASVLSSYAITPDPVPVMGLYSEGVIKLPFAVVPVSGAMGPVYGVGIKVL